MQSEPTQGERGPSPESVQYLVLHLLQEPGGPPMWSLRELASELGGELDAADAVSNLCAAGLAHRCREFVFASRAATRMAALAESI
jgi:hypothetical protein